MGGPAENYTIPWISRANRGHRAPQKGPVLYENSVLNFPGDRSRGRTLTRKNKSSRGLRRRLRVRCVTALGPEGPISFFRVGKLTPPFPSVGRRQTRALFAFGPRRSLRTDSPTLRTGLTQFKCCHMEPFSASVLKGSHLGYLLLPPRSAPWRSRRAPAGTFKTTPPRPSYSLRLNLHGKPA
ncbi:hypothetical protein JTE90_015046 [Oedothorax gibbosus]|uniref:Uncharacterized protein n=1 Tax=Oedothorax gibbosus TaxID=931172 RepID=A0AAV6TLY8_9ARAC|nr:hypothetical protein JTE90_015046 [Oedothorax gibbosus]